MPNATYFVQECPTCGRKLEILVEYLGRSLACTHCHGRFIAQQGSSARVDASEANSTLLKRADALLQRVSKDRGLTPTTSSIPTVDRPIS